MTFESSSSGATKKFGASIASDILKGGSRSGAVVLALIGDLGGGKTTFVQGFAHELGVRGRVTSPTFVLMRRFALRRRGFRALYHLDAYRLGGVADLRSLGFLELLRDPQNIIVVEWADRIQRALPPSTKRMYFSHGSDGATRSIKIK